MNKERFPGRFITLEGPDGSGKTSNVDNLVRELNKQGYNTVVSREPGGTPVGELIRGIILNYAQHPVTEALLFAASRAEHIHTKIIPLLREGTVVVSDRFQDSSHAYQAVGRGLRDEVAALEKLVLGEFEPHYTLFFDVTLDESIRRLNGRLDETNRLDSEAVDFKARLYEGYQERLRAHPHRMVRIDAMGTPDMVAWDVRDWVRNVFVPHNPRPWTPAP